MTKRLNIDVIVKWKRNLKRLIRLSYLTRLQGGYYLERRHIFLIRGNFGFYRFYKEEVKIAKDKRY